jgi:hypothetical protein
MGRPKLIPSVAREFPTETNQGLEMMENSLAAERNSLSDLCLKAVSVL